MHLRLVCAYCQRADELDQDGLVILGVLENQGS